MTSTAEITSLSNPELVTIAVALLGGDIDYADREDIAIKVNDIGPGRFNWRKHPERIDLDAVGVALRDAKKPKNGALLVGSNATGWMLSPSGTRWIKTLELAGFREPQSTQHRKDSIPANLEAERTRLRNTKAYLLFIGGTPEAIARQDFYEFARVNEYFQTRARHRRHAVIDNAVADDGVLFELWRSLKERFSEEMV